MSKLSAVALLICTSLAPLILSSCATGIDFVPPQASLVDVRVGDVTLLETNADFILRLTNENPDPVTVAGAVYTIEADGRPLGKGVSGSRIEIAPFATATDRVRISLSNLRMATRWVSLIDRGKLRYKIDSKLHVETPRGRATVRSSNSGELDFTEPAEPAYRY